jgi:hypothetical protein
MKRFVFCMLLLAIGLPAFGQDNYINKYTLYTGSDFVVSPSRNLNEYGFDTDFGVTVKPWLGLGFDFGAFGHNIYGGSGTLNGSETIYAPVLNSAFQNGIPGAGIPPGYVGPASAVNVSFKATTYLYAGGGQFYWRKWKYVTFLGRPGFGAIHETADLTLPAGLAGLFPPLGITPPSSHQSCTTWFIGLGGGVDLNVSKRMGIRITADWINTHLFSNLLTDRQNYMRFTVGPVWRWGDYNR